MAGERTSDGYLIRLKPHGIGRFFGAAFLTVWICGWAVGEAFAFWLLGTGAMALMGVEMPAGPKVSLPAGPAVAMGAFLLFWVALWTLGGVMAIREWLRLMWAEDRILVHGSGVRVTWCTGPFRRTKEYPRETVRGVLLARHLALTLETEGERVELSPLGTLREREEAMTWLRSELGVGDGAGVSTDGAPVSLPKGWEESITAEGERALVPDRRTRKAQARFTGILTLVMAAAMLSLASGSLSSPSLVPGAILALCATIGLAWGTLWLVRGRMEWKIGSGRITLRRRFAATLRDEFESDRLEVVVTRDSDGDEWFALEAVRGEGTVNVTNPMEAARQARKTRRRITSALHDSTVPLRLGTWLSRAAGIPINDRTSAEARQFDIAVLKGQLDESGPVGKFALKLIEKVETKRAEKS